MRSIRKHLKPDSLIQTLRDAPSKQRVDIKSPTHEMQPPSHCGTLKLARMGSMSHTIKGSLREYYAELQGGAIYLYPGHVATMHYGAVRGSARLVFEVSYCSELRKHAALNAGKGSASCAANKEVMVKMEQMKNCHMLALYARCGVYWCQFETIGELNAWQQAISAALEELEEQPKRTAKAAAFVKLEPLIWQQLLSQTENMRAFVSQFASYDGACASEERVREKHNGWLYVRQSADDAEEEDSLSAEGWTYRFVGLSGMTLFFYENEHAVLPCDLVCLEHSSLRLAGGSEGFSGFVFSLSTPLRTLELRARAQEQLDDWSEQIMLVQGAIGRAKLIPKGHSGVMRSMRQHWGAKVRISRRRERKAITREEPQEKSCKRRTTNGQQRQQMTTGISTRCWITHSCPCEPTKTTSLIS